MAPPAPPSIAKLRVLERSELNGKVHEAFRGGSAEESSDCCSSVNVVEVGDGDVVGVAPELLLERRRGTLSDSSRRSSSGVPLHGAASDGSLDSLASEQQCPEWTPTMERIRRRVLGESHQEVEEQQHQWQQEGQSKPKKPKLSFSIEALIGIR